MWEARVRVLKVHVIDETYLRIIIYLEQEFHNYDHVMKMMGIDENQEEENKYE